MTTTDKLEHARQNGRGWAETISALVAALQADKYPAKVDGDEIENADDLLERIQEGPLSVQVRSGWCEPDAKMVAEEFEILLSTGGPALRIVGELDEHKQPATARLEGQDWGTPWTYLYGLIDEETLLAYCQQFYFGE